MPDRFRALVLGAAFGGQSLSSRTIGNYLSAFLRLAQCLDVPAEIAAGISNAAMVWVGRGRVAPKRRDAAISAFHEEGGSWDGARKLAVRYLDDTDHASWRTEARRRRREAAVLLIVLNSCARTGDVARWPLGTCLRRRADGSWSLRYTTGKNRMAMSFSRLWPETCRALDLLLLDGRPAEQIDRRYAALAGRHWLTHQTGNVPARHPSDLVKGMINLSSHPLRTLAADALRMLDPASAPGKARSWLGHRDPRSTADYAAAAQGLVASECWAQARTRLATPRAATK